MWPCRGRHEELRTTDASSGVESLIWLHVHLDFRFLQFFFRYENNNNKYEKQSSARHLDRIDF